MNSPNYTIEHHVKRIDTATYIERFYKPHEFILLCKSCPRYSQSWACPPFDYNPLSIITKYPYLNIIVSKVNFSPHFIDKHRDTSTSNEILDQVMIDVRKVIDKRLMELEEAHTASLALFAGRCLLCPSGCTRKKDQPCRYPSKIRPSLEAYGFDLAKTIQSLFNLSFQWSKQGKIPPYLCLISGFLTSNKHIKLLF